MSALIRRSRSPRSGTAGSSRHLDPKDQLLNALTAFENELKERQKGMLVRFKNLRTATLPDFTGVIRIAEQISNDCADRHGGWRHYAMRVIPFFERIRQLSSIGDVLIGGAQNMVASGVWAAVRLAVESSLSFLSFFDKVSDLLFRVAKYSQLHQEYTAIFPQSDVLQGLTYEYLAVVVQTSTQIVRFANKSGWSQIASSLVSTFETTFLPLEDQLKEIGHRIELCSNALAMKTSQVGHTSLQRSISSLQRAISSKWQHMEVEVARHRVLVTLCSNQGEFDIVYRELRRKGNPKWILREELYEHWKFGHETHRFLCLRGSLGSGKSVTMASVVAGLIVDPGKPPMLS